MPVVKKSDGWYWGKNGPHATKAKAEQVERAAYANGYKETKKSTRKKSTRKKNK